MSDKLDKLRGVLASTIGKDNCAKLDADIFNYVVSILGDDALLGDTKELAETLAPYFVDAGVVSEEEEVMELAQQLVSQLRVAGPTEHLVKLTSTIKLANAVQADSDHDWMRREAKATLVNDNKLEAEKTRYEKRQLLREARANRKEEAKKSTSLTALRTLQDIQASRVDHAKKDSGKIARDVKVENFSVSYGKVTLIQNATLTVVAGRRYGLIGRNGTGKTTLMRHIATREIDIPKNISILHVEQEVVGDDTSAVLSVLAADAPLMQLWAEEKRLLAAENTQVTSDKLKRVYDRLSEIDAPSAEPRARAILAGLGFTPDMQDSSTKIFSGGWRMRIALARALYVEPDLLLLDEPTNHLDLFACLWLERYLLDWPKTLLIVSHQRDFLNVVCTDVIHLSAQTLTYYRGNYDEFETTRANRMKQQSREHEAQTKHRKHMQQFIDRFRYNAKRASMAQSRLKTLEKMVIVPEVVEDPSITMNFLEPEQLNPPILQFQGASFGYPGKDALFSELNFGIDMDSRVALVGPNGVGKSTLLSLLAGDLHPTDGQSWRNGKLRFARFSQHFVDQLDLSMSALEYFMQQNPTVKPQESRAQLGRFGLSGDIALRTMNTLSGGQKSRVVFALTSFKNPHVLLLDEPSNHLDLDTIEALSLALNRFSGGVLLVSHDERLINLVCDEIWYFEDNSVKVFEGDMKSYKKMVLEQLS